MLRSAGDGEVHGMDAAVEGGGQAVPAELATSTHWLAEKPPAAAAGGRPSAGLVGVYDPQACDGPGNAAGDGMRPGPEVERTAHAAAQWSCSARRSVEPPLREGPLEA